VDLEEGFLHEVIRGGRISDKAMQESEQLVGIALDKNVESAFFAG